MFGDSRTGLAPAPAPGGATAVAVFAARRAAFAVHSFLGGLKQPPAPRSGAPPPPPLADSRMRGVDVRGLADGSGTRARPWRGDGGRGFRCEARRVRRSFFSRGSEAAPRPAERGPTPASARG